MTTTETTAIAVRDEQSAMAQEMSVEMVLRQTAKIQELMQGALQKDVHYGVIPGTGTKPTLLKPGAEKLCLMFRFAPEYLHIKDREPNGHLTIESTCRLIHSPSGTLVATGSAICSTHESKYAYRKAQRACPQCGVAAIFKDKNAPGYYCWAKRDGCGAKFQNREEIASIENQETGRVPNEDLADQWNTIIKMADKRSLIAALLNGTAASDIFTQDLEEIRENLEARTPAPETPRQSPSDGKLKLTSDSPPPPPQADTDIASKSHRTTLWSTIKAKMGEKMGYDWLQGQYAAHECTTETMTIGQFTKIYTAISNWKPSPLPTESEGMSDKDVEWDPDAEATPDAFHATRPNR